ncbi:MAG TPA: hypothetical protein VI911_06870 [Patescibacteria group bacterium]|nr:hypothetical protein [Patescibacteria group bacterium]
MNTSIENMLGGIPGFYITMSIGQWDNFLDEGYYRQDATLIELNDNEYPVAAYRLEKGANTNA